MEFLLFIVVVIGVLGWFVWKDRKFDESGSHPLDGATKVLDVNNDGKVNLQDAVAAAEVVVEKAKKTVAKAKTTAKPAAKPAAKKTVAKAVTKKTTAKKTKK